MTNQISPTPYAISPPIRSLQLSQFVSCSLKCSAPLGLTPPSPAPLFCFPTFFFGYSFCLFLSLCSTESNSDWPSPTGLCWCPTLRRWSVSPIFSSLSLPPSVPFPLPSPFLFVTSVDTLTGRDSQTSQFPYGLGYFALGLRKDFQLTRLYTSLSKKKIKKSKSDLGPRIWICHSLPHEMTYNSHNRCFLLDNINTIVSLLFRCVPAELHSSPLLPRSLRGESQPNECRLLLIMSFIYAMCRGQKWTME